MSEVGSAQIRPARAITVTVHGLAVRPQGAPLDGGNNAVSLDAARRLLRVEPAAGTRRVRRLSVTLRAARPVQIVDGIASNLALLHSE
jgi:hypothetical protein